MANPARIFSALLAGTLTAGAVTSASHAQQAASRAPVLTLQRQITLLPASALTAADLDEKGWTVDVDGRGQKVLDLSPAGTWQTVIYLDPALSTPKGVRGSVAALSAAADRLAALGPVDVVVADPFTDAYLSGSRNASEIRAALEELEDFADGAGEVLAIRQELAAAAAELDPESRQLAVDEELELQQESRLELMRWLARQPTSGPRCLVLLQDGFDLTTASAEVREAHERLATTLASAGWTTLPLVFDEAADDLLPGRRETLELLGQSSGGVLITGRGQLGPLLEQMAQSQVMTVGIEGLPDGIPRPLRVQSVSGARVLVPSWISLTTPIFLTEIRALQTLEDPDLIIGTWSTAGILRPDSDAGATGDGVPVVVEALTELRTQIGGQPVFRISLLLFDRQGPPRISYDLALPTDLTGAEAWLYRKRLTVSRELAAGAIVVEELQSGQWGSAPLDLAEEPFSTVGRRIAVWEAPDSPAPDLRTPRRQAPEAEEQVVIRVLPPRKRPVVGTTRFETLVSSPIVSRVTFLLDGEQVAEDDNAPFAATLDLGPEAGMHRVEVVAFAAGGARLGSHQITVNPRDDSFQVRITDIANPLGGTYTVTAGVRLPADAQLDRVEFYWNETLVETLRQEPYQVELPVPDPGAQAFVRVVAYLADGTWIDDASLLGEGAISERVEVNLVELHVMVTDRDNKPVDGLTREDFTVRLGREEKEIERFGFAEEVPLTLGVVIDTSESMWPLMVETQKAGAQFVANTLTENDSAFLVDFDTQPRLAQDTTSDVVALLKTFSRFEPSGLTALYDSIIFSMLQFEEREGRKALVLLTDGDDVKSRYGPRRCIQYGKRLGVPVYIISLAGVHDARRNLRRIDLEGITEGTGGRVFYIREMSELAEAYETINRELRSQYILTFSTDRELTELELEEVDVDVAGKGLEIRGVVGGQRVQ